MIQKVTLSEIVGESGVFVDGDWVESKDQDVNGDVRLIQLADIGDGNFINKSNRFLTSKKARELNCTFLEAGDLLIARMPDPLGRACIFPGLKTPCVTVVDICIVRPDKNIATTEWLKFMINSFDFRNTINKFITGTTRQRISRGNLNKLKFKLPPLEDQIRIANILSKAEALISQRKEGLRLLDELLKSTFLEMFGDPSQCKKTDIIKTVGEICQFKGGGTPSKSKPEYFTGDIPWVSPKDMKSLYIVTSQDKITKQAIEESSTSLIPKGAVLMVVRSGILKSKLPVAINKVEVTINQDMKAFTSKEVLATYLLYFFITNERNILKMVRATTADNFNFEDIKKLSILIPPLKLQTQFAHIVEKTEALKAQYQTSLQELENLYGSLSQRAFSSAGASAQAGKGELGLKGEGASYAEALELSSPTKQFITKLESFKSLEPNWDSYGAQPPSSKTVETAISFVKKADKNELPLYFVAPGPNGELVIKFRKGKKEASAFINPDGSTELILNEGNNYVLEGTLEDNYKDLLNFINA
jgi:type I restriction enzyme S subunit